MVALAGLGVKPHLPHARSATAALDRRTAGHRQPTTWCRTPPLWMVLRLGTLAVLVAAAYTAVRWRRAGGDRRRLAALMAGAVVFLPWAVYWGLLTP